MERILGDKNINNVHEAAHFIEHKLSLSYKEHGFGLFLVKLKEKDIAIGMCGLVNRPVTRPKISLHQNLKKWTKKVNKFQD